MGVLGLEISRIWFQVVFRGEFVSKKIQGEFSNKTHKHLVCGFSLEINFEKEILK